MRRRSGEGRLADALVTKALHAADALVESNCQGSDREIVVNDDPGPLAPATATDMQSIGSMKHCVPAPGAPATTTTTTVASAGTPSGGVNGIPGGTGSSMDDSSFGSPVPLVTAPGATNSSTDSTGVANQPGSTSSSSGIDATKHTLNGVLTASKLPLPMPAGSSSSDRLATFLLGAALYLCLRKPVGRLARRVAT